MLANERKACNMAKDGMIYRTAVGIKANGKMAIPMVAAKCSHQTGNYSTVTGTKEYLKTKG
jgi:hypothetical protein